MLISYGLNPPLAHLHSSIRDCVMTVISALGIIASTHAAIPLYPVPMTLQATVICIIGLLNSPRVACHSVATYLMIGLAGFPVFSGGKSGIIAFTGPTAGYLIGFLAGVFFIANCRKFYSSFFAYFCICLGGLAIIIASGVTYLSMLIGMKKALAVGAQPFIIKDIFSAIIAASAAKLIYPSSTTRIS